MSRRGGSLEWNASTFDPISGAEINDCRNAHSRASKSDSRVYRQPRPFSALSNGELYQFGDGSRLQPTLARTSFHSTLNISKMYTPHTTHVPISPLANSNAANHFDIITHKEKVPCRFAFFQKGAAKSDVLFFFCLAYD